MQNVKLALVKTVPVKGDLASNHAVLMSILEDIAPTHPDVIITPECFLDGYVVTEKNIDATNLLDYSVDPATSPFILAARAFASKHKTMIIYGCTRRAPQGAYNSALIIERNGSIAGIYDKTHIQTHDAKFQRGEALPVFESWFGTFGVMICADRRWPETVRTLALKGARIIFNPTYGMHDEYNLHMMQTRSYESEVIIAFAHPSQSLVTGPYSNIHCNNTRDDDRFSLCEVDLDLVDVARSSPSAHLPHRRPDLYIN